MYKSKLNKLEETFSQRNVIIKLKKKERHFLLLLYNWS